MKSVISIAARMASSRLPGKTLAALDHRPMLARIVERLKDTGMEIVIATTDHAEDRRIVAQSYTLGVDCVRGSQTDLMARHAQVARQADADVIFLAGADDPFLDPSVFMLLGDTMETGDYDYAKTAGWPLGMNVWAWTREAMEDGDRLAKEPEERQHVVPFWERRPRAYPSTVIRRAGPDLYDKYRLTVDTQDDLDLARAIYGILGADFDPEDVIDLLERHPVLATLNGINLHGTAARDAIYSIEPVDERVTA